MERIEYPAFAVLLGVLLLLAAPAHAEVQDDLDGVKAFKAHDYEKAEKLFLQALSKSTDEKESAGIRENLELVREMLGKAPKDKSLPQLFKEHEKEQPPADPQLHPLSSFGIDPSSTNPRPERAYHPVDQHGVEGAVRLIYTIDEKERAILASPRIGTRQVIDHYETEIVGYNYDAFGNRSSPITRQYPVYRTEEYERWREEDLEFYKLLLDLATRTGIKNEIYSMRSTLVHGGAVVELVTGWVLKVDQQLPWSPGDTLLITGHPQLELPYVALSGKTEPGRFTAEIVAEP